MVRHLVVPPPLRGAARLALLTMLLLALAVGSAAGTTRAAEEAPLPHVDLPWIVANGTTLRSAETWEPFEVRGVNYLRPTTTDPRECPEIQFGFNSNCPWDRAEIEADMKRLQARGVNTVRVFLNYYTFGGLAATSPTYDMEPTLTRLEEFVAIANMHHIYVMPVLLAKYPQDTHFDPEDFWQAYRLHIKPVVERFSGRSGILAWDLFNEPDIAGPVDVRCWDWDNGDFPLCFNVATQRLLFLNMLRDEVRQLDEHRLLTVSVAFAKSYFEPSGAYTARLADLVDFYSFHYYDNDPYDCGRYAQHWYYSQGFPRDLERSIEELQALNLHKVTVITEVGFPSGPGTLRTLDEAHRDLAMVLRTTRRRQVSGIILWPFQEPSEVLINDLFW